MCIYTSEQVRPYVYLCTHKETGKFYIGYRERNILPADQDLPLYKTSSKEVKPVFSEFSWMIVAEFYSGDDAYDFEQELIFSHWGDPMLINKNCRHLGKRFKTAKGRKAPHCGKAVAKDPVTGGILGLIDKSDPRWSTKEIVFNMTGTKQSDSTIKKRLANTDRNKLRSWLGKTGDQHPAFSKPLTDVHKQKISEGSKGKKKPVGFGQKEKNSNFGLKHPGINAGSKNPMFGKTGEQHPNFNKPMSDESKLRGNKEKYINVALLLLKGVSVKEISKQLDVAISAIYRIKNKSHIVWNYVNADQL